MTRRNWMFGLVALLAVSFIGAPTRAAEKKASDSELGKAMEELGKTVKALRKSVKDPAKNEESLKLAEQAEKLAMKSRDLKPTVVEKAPADKQKELQDGYTKMMDEVVANFGKLKEQLKAGKNDDAVETMKKLKKLEDDGHEIYNP